MFPKRTTCMLTISITIFLKMAHMSVFISAIFLLYYACFIRQQSKKPSFEALVIGKQIRYLRRVKDMSQLTLAKKVGVSVGRIERGIFLPNVKLLIKIAKALQVRLKDLIPNEL
jgi:DNA-binding XRE family transcriptional regulator